MTASAPTTAPPDVYEETASALEKAQQERYRKDKHKDTFWTGQGGVWENKIFEEIKAARVKSTTYHPDNER